MGCLDLTVALLNTTLAVAGTVVPPTAEAAAIVTPPTARVAVSGLAPVNAHDEVTVYNSKPTVACSIVEAIGQLHLTVDLVPPPSVTVEMDPVPTIEAEILNDLQVTAENATAEITTEIEPSFVCFVNEDDIAVLATADGEALRTANGGYLRLEDDDENEEVEPGL